MAQLIDKAAVVAEIERLDELMIFEPITPKVTEDYKCGYEHALDKIKSFLNTLEVKEVDLNFEQELYKAFGQVKDFTLGMRIAKHFFELGRLNARKEE